MSRHRLLAAIVAMALLLATTLLLVTTTLRADDPIGSEDNPNAESNPGEENNPGDKNKRVDTTPQRIATANWTVAETLLALGITPYAIADIPNYRKWVGAPDIPADTLDIGLRNQPNLELLAQHPPDLLLTSALFSRDNARLERLAPLRVVDNFSSDETYYVATLDMTRKIAAMTGHEAAAEALIAATERQLEATAAAFEGETTPVYIVQFSDTQHVRVFGEGNMVGTLFERTPLENAFTGITNDWGYANIAIDQLAQRPDARIVVIRPFPREVDTDLSNNQIWQHLPAVREGRVDTIIPIWPYGGLSSLQRLMQAMRDVVIPASESGS